jgi:hypothetical protein
MRSMLGDLPEAMAMIDRSQRLQVSVARTKGRLP